MTKEKGLNQYVAEFENNSAAARSLSISPQLLYFIMLNHSEEHYVKIQKDKVILCRIVSVRNLL